LEILKPLPGKKYLDGTVGGGGHSERILIESSPTGQVLGLDRDDEALVASRKRLEPFGARFTALQASFGEAKEILARMGWRAVDGAVLDLGISSQQIDSTERGFSFRADARLDMRMDRRQALDAEQVVNAFSEAALEEIFRKYGEEPRARSIARAIVAERKIRPLRSTMDLVGVIERVKGRGRRDRHPATQVFQALRIAVNRELEELERFLEDGYEILRPGGRLAIISFHSLEDRMVKTAFRKWSRDCLCPPHVLRCECGWSRKATLLTKKPISPTAEEVRANPRARSAKLRAVERI
jgi:16S rRNA (cytosine1402-N4)-methyltransferase